MLIFLICQVKLHTNNRTIKNNQQKGLILC
uniref:Uncharacterized protein n=1 Tax=Siphoviridae sp. ctLkp13 TaxID=2826252 RepID=A0A8S5LSR3_9CAUD|nr:MAG TPA: hypothetical protein [Siphoviridae sp. ctLkp13]